ncbi:MAG TPA: NAD(P)-dependent alcohol dehydrogenase [Terracidiphilus sp.]|jgi:NADPH:quinone reductase-like Zn-dependent oxidoreductase|nr:NAD(P)-dependent alcohol dehydrogenase [Terracidiphilus sp.]
MQAITYHHYGTPDVLTLEDIPRRVPADDEVLVAVRAASVNPYDWHFMRGTPKVVRLFMGMGGPRFPGLGADVAGVVESVGGKVTRFRAGDAVFGMARGAFAEFACAKESQLAVKPESVSFEQAASLPIAGVTALQGLRDRANVLPEQSVLINGAAGGVGTFALQIAKILGAEVTGVCSTHNVDLVLSLGADHAIDYTREDFTRSMERYDAIFDLVGNRSLKDLRRVLRARGVYVGCGGGGPDRGGGEMLRGMLELMLAGPFVSQKLTSVLARVNADDLSKLSGWVAAGSLVPVLDRSYALREVPEAIRYVETCHARGKVTIAVA